MAEGEEWLSLAAMLKAGKRSWTDAEDRYLSEWRAWERDFDRKIEDGNKEWDERIAKHMADREQWEVDLKKKASEAASEAALTEVLGGFNTQLQTLASNAGISMTPVSLTDAIERAKSEIMANLPTQADQLASINESIERFNTNLALSEMWGTDTQSALAGLSTDFRNEMGNFQKQMVVYANAKILEQYQKLMSDLLEQIDRQNRAIEQQTEMAALGAGFVRSGNVYIKQSKLVSSAVGMVEAYQWYDGKGAFDRFISSVGGDSGGALLRDKNGGMINKSRNEIMADLPSFLEAADTVQVESFFSVQKLILQHAFEKIMGTGTVSERKNSRDKEVIGELAWWIGKPAGSSEFVSQVEQAAPHLGAEEQKKLGMDGSITAIDGFKYLADPGFGELGSGGNRPSGIYLGFYNKLDLVNRYIDGKDSGRMERIAGSIDPLTATINQFNPVVMLANAVQNVRVASEVYGRDAGYMWEAQLLGAVKGALPAIGSAIGSLAGPAGTAIGSAIGSAIASTIHVDAKTGKRDYQTTDQTGISLAIAAATWGASSYAQSAMTAAQQSAEAIRMTQEAIAITSAAVSGGMKYNENGRLQGGFDVTGASISAVSSYAGNNWGGAFGGGKVSSFLASDITSTILNTGVQYHNYSHGYENSYAALANPDLTRLGALGGGLLGAAYNDTKAREFIAWARDAGHSEEAIINGLNTLGYSEFAEQLQNELAKQTDQGYRVGMSAAGIMRRKEEEADWVDYYGEDDISDDRRRSSLSDFDPDYMEQRLAEAMGELPEGERMGQTPRKDSTNFDPLDFFRGDTAYTDLTWVRRKDGGWEITRPDGQRATLDKDGRLILYFSIADGVTGTNTWQKIEGEYRIIQTVTQDKLTGGNYITHYGWVGKGEWGVVSRQGVFLLGEGVSSPFTQGQIGGTYWSNSPYGNRGAMHYGVDNSQADGYYAPVELQLVSVSRGGLSGLDPKSNTETGVYRNALTGEIHYSLSGMIHPFSDNPTWNEKVTNANGRESFKEPLGGAGNMVVLQTTNTTGQKFFIEMMHLPGFSDNILDWSSLDPRQRAQRPIIFKAGEKIGDIGTTGHSQGYHAHLGVFTYGAPPEGVPDRYVHQDPHDPNKYHIDPAYFLRIIAPKLR